MPNGTQYAQAMQPIKPIKDLRGVASIADMLGTLDPQDAALLAQGIDPYSGDMGQNTMMNNTPASNPQDAAQKAQAVMDSLYMALSGITPSDERSALAAASIQQAIDALSGGLEEVPTIGQ